MNDVELFEQEFDIQIDLSAGSATALLEVFAEETEKALPDGAVPLRFVVTGSTDSSCHCEIGALRECDSPPESIFGMRYRDKRPAGAFNAVLLVPTGIGAEIGGHAGDARIQHDVLQTRQAQRARR